MIEAPQPVESYPSTARRWGAVAILGLAVLLSFTDRLIINLVVDEVRADLLLSDLAISLLLGAGFALMYAVAGVPLGRVADRSNRRNLVIAGILVWSAATIGCGLAGNFTELIIARICVGLGEAALMPAACSLIADSFPVEQRGRALGTFGVGAVFGSGIALSFGGLLLGWVGDGLLRPVPYLAELAPWRNVLILAGLPGLPLAVLMLALVFEPTRKDSAGATQPMRAVFSTLAADRWRIGRLCLSFGVVAAGDYGLMGWLPTVLRRDHGLAPASVGQIVGLVVAASGLVGCLFAGWLSDRVATRHGAPARIYVMVGGFLLCFVSALALFVPDPAVLILAAVGWILGSVIGSVAGHVRLQESVANEMRGTVLAFSYMSSAIVGMGTGPTLVVFFGSIVGDDNGGLGVGIAGVCALAALIGTSLVLPRLPRLSAAKAPEPA